MKTRILFLIPFLFLSMMECSFAISAPSCLNQPIADDIDYLKCLKNNVVTRSTKNHFRWLIEKRNQCPECAPFFPREKNFAPLFGLRFLVLKIADADFGGYALWVMYHESLTRIYRLWIYPIDGGTYQVREIVSIIPEAETERILKTLRQKPYDNFFN